MKILIVTALLGALGAGSYQLAAPPPANPAPGECNATVTCTPEGTCRITCEDENGATCSIEIECDEGECRVVDCDGSEDCASSCATACPPAAPSCCPGS